MTECSCQNRNKNKKRFNFCECSIYELDDSPEKRPSVMHVRFAGEYNIRQNI
jgi:hypothetical protein